MKLGIDNLLSDQEKLKQLASAKVSLVAHPASVNSQLMHTFNALLGAGVKLNSAFGPQHGLRGEKQDNMVESHEFVDQVTGVKVFSLYGVHRRPTFEAMQTFDICLFDLQDVGTRIYTFLTTLLYMMQACTEHRKELWILDRPNPAGRPIEGSLLQPGWESFVGAGPFPMRHGLTLGECALWMKSFYRLNLDLKIIPMLGYQMNEKPFYGWSQELAWVNPSPNAASPHMAKIFPGSVMFEGTHLSEARGTTKPLEMWGAPDIDIEKILKTMHRLAPDWMQGAPLRTCFFEPTFHKHQKTLCQGLQVHTDHPSYKHEQFKPYRLVTLFFKALRTEYPSYEIWRDFHYEYEKDRLAIDLINGSPLMRVWVDDPKANVKDFEAMLVRDENQWREQVREFLLY
jgi:uncharacterized protein YbbC (DUF1343 family)